MRLTINLDDDLYAMARAHAISSGMSISKAVGDLLRRRIEPPHVPATDEETTSYFDPVLGIQVSRGRGPLTNEDVARMIEDDDIRHLEAAGIPYPPEEPK